jgi:hypothetical protein
MTGRMTCYSHFLWTAFLPATSLMKAQQQAWRTEQDSPIDLLLL